MSKKNPKVQTMSLMEAIDNLSSMADLDTLEEKEGTSTLRAARWIDTTSDENTTAHIKQSFKVVHDHLKQVVKDKKKLSDEGVQKGVRSMMKLAGEAIEKVDTCTDIFRSLHGGGSTLKEFRDLQEFYTQKIASRFRQAVEDEDEWIAEFVNGELSPLDVKKQSLKDMGTVKRDRRYELFYISKEDGSPFFNRNLLRHLKLANDYDAIIEHQDAQDPFIRLPVILDRQLHEVAVEIKREVKMHLSEFFKRAPAHKTQELAITLYGAISALCLASSQHNRIQNTTGKSTCHYFQDFQHHLRAAISSTEYARNAIVDESKIDPFDKCAMRLADLLAFLFFTATPAYEEALGMIHLLTATDETKKKSSLWNELLEMHEQMTSALRSFPNGPLFKTLDTFIAGKRHGGFDPLAQDNFPSSVYQLDLNQHTTHLFRTPSPTKQLFINKAALVEEFNGWVRYIQAHKNLGPALLINLQDRTHAYDRARCDIIESTASEAFHVITLPKNTPFYFQSDEYLKLDNAVAFKKQLCEQLQLPEASGFFFSAAINQPQIKKFSKELIETMHTHLFKKAKTLSRKTRLDFIELFYHFLTLKILDLLKPHYVGVLCKDGLDTTLSTCAGLFAFSRIFAPKGDFSEEESSFLKWLIFGPVLMVRERSIDIGRLSRMVSAIAHLDDVLQGEAKAKKAFAKHFSPHLLTRLHPRAPS